MKHSKPAPLLPPLWTSLCLLLATLAAAADDRFVGVWTRDEGFQIVELLFRSDGRYQLDTRSTDPNFDFESSELGRYEVGGEALTLLPYEFIGEPNRIGYTYDLTDGRLTLNRTDTELSYVYEFKPNSREDVLAREKVARDPIGVWMRAINFAGTEEYMFRPDGHYFRRNTPEDNQFPPEYVRGTYQIAGPELMLHPYSYNSLPFEIDFFGDTLTLIRNEETSGGSTTYRLIPGSRAEVLTRSTEAAGFLAQTNWHVGTWEIREAHLNVDLTFRPDAHYTAVNSAEFLNGIVRGRYDLKPGGLRLSPFVGQDPYARSNGDFGKVEADWILDYYDGELQFIDPRSLSQKVILARKRPGSAAPVMDKVRVAQAERAQDGWFLGIWQVQDPLGWMEFTFRPDQRYIAQSGIENAPSRVERGFLRVGDHKVTLSPYFGSGPARGFELDYYDGDLFLIGDTARMVIARKKPNSDTEVIEKTRNPSAMTGERGAILGRWTTPLPGQSTELVFRPDGQFRLHRCSDDVPSQDYGLYSVNLAARTMVYDSRFAPTQTLGLDFYDDTLTLHGGPGGPSTYKVNLGTVDADIADSLEADAIEALSDARWIGRIPVGPKNPGAVYVPTGDLPNDPQPSHVFGAPTVMTGYQLYRRLIPGFVYFNVQGTIKSVAVVNTREWHFFPTGRVLVRFKNTRAGVFYPTTETVVTDNWGAYRVEPKPEATDILHIYADNGVFIETDLGEQVAMTLENGRRQLFWEKDYLLQSEWASEQKPVPCVPATQTRPGLANTGIALSTSIVPDPTGDQAPVLLGLSRSPQGTLILSGRTEVAASVVIEGAQNLVAPVTWTPIQTNAVAAGRFELVIQQGTTAAAAYFRIRGQ
ncbi:MAG: hypothetical protein IT581_19760 [Verrucomicrobiales bacterium]|nr:hypothetical protein [Verrucomicrobiales bacterium]